MSSLNDMQPPVAPRTARLGKVYRVRGRGRFRTLVLLTLATGMVAGFGAAVATGVPGSAHVRTNIPDTTPPAIAAGDIFPPVPPVHQTIDVYDPPPPAMAEPDEGNGGGDE